MATSATLSLAELKQLQVDAVKGKRVNHKPTLIKFVESGDVFVDVMTLPAYADAKIDSAAISLQNNYRLLKAENPEWPEIEISKVMEDGEVPKLLLINMTKLAGEIESLESELNDGDADEEVSDDELPSFTE